MRNLIDKIHDIPIEEGIGKYITLTKKGINFMACCPFHDEKTPSFSVSPVKAIWKCFGECGTGGDLIGFVMKHKNLDFMKAVTTIADEHGIQYEQPQYNEEEKAAAETRSKDRIAIFEINKVALEYFQQQFLASKEAVNYMYGRIDHCLPQWEFEIGYAPNGWQGFYNYAKEKGYDFKAMEKAGLVKKGQGRNFDVFRNRLIFPIRNMSGAVVGFGGRDLSGDKEVAKYLNTAENAAFNKSRVLYGLYHAIQAKAIIKADEINLVEGYTDVIKMHWLGSKNTVASCGTSLTVDQCNLMKRFTKIVNLVYDGDNAGRKAAERAGELLLQCGLNVSITPLPLNQDPGEFFKMEMPLK